MILKTQLPLLQELTQPNHIPLAVQFLRTRLTGKARLGLPENVGTIDDLINDVKLRCNDLTTSDNKMAKLKLLKQKGNIDIFCSECSLSFFSYSCTTTRQTVIAKTMNHESHEHRSVNKVITVCSHKSIIETEESSQNPKCAKRHKEKFG